jgi:Cu/Ag efflux protein CusF
MKTVSIIALIIAVLTLAITSYQIRELQNEQKLIVEDVLKLKQEMARSWQHAPKSTGEEWPKYHDATGILKLITGNRVVIDQDEMPGFMRAMIMSYEVENPEQLSTLRQEDKVKLKLKETETSLTVVSIEKE